MIKLALITIGAISIIGAIAKGGVKSKELELPTIHSVSRQIILGVFGVILIVIGLCLPEEGHVEEKPVDTRKTFSFYSLYDSLNSQIINCIKTDSLIYSSESPKYKIEITDSVFEQLKSESVPGTSYYHKSFPSSTLKILINGKEFEIMEIALPATEKFREESDARKDYKNKFWGIVMKKENIKIICYAIRKNINK